VIRLVDTHQRRLALEHRTKFVRIESCSPIAGNGFRSDGHPRIWQTPLTHDNALLKDAKESVLTE
jgi:hypothetical protein